MCLFISTMDRIVAQVRRLQSGLVLRSLVLSRQPIYISTIPLLSDIGLRGRLLPHQCDLQTPARYWVYATLLSDSRFAVRVAEGLRAIAVCPLLRFLTLPPLPGATLQLYGESKGYLHCAPDVVDKNVCVVLHHLYSF